MRKFIAVTAATLALLGGADVAQAAPHGGSYHGGFSGGSYHGGYRGGGYRGGGYSGGYGRGGYYRGGGYYGGALAAGAIGFGLGAALASPYYYDDGYYGYGPGYYGQPAYGCGGWQWNPGLYRYVWVGC